ncbi:5-hydroxytryptamine receptor 2B-like [Xyrauchen texanus]|uniref:5-hydroxytryptamine receptor 2B-like n=1 Tax=Xyrauchen texanus TaxID=154827 RepID=UPI002241B62A|nr:5-hydroxytryptamine receptor 2B-like [Xyrauchen texanus]XP_051977664.1 5-hydroxytryptamine receptor 2B-like [Xyrauchen texanus]
MSQREASLLEFNQKGSEDGAYLQSGQQLRWAALLILLVIIPTIGGNILVILAVSLERKLQNATNFFLMSLAVADLLVGVLVMPIALVTVLFYSRWPLPDFLCPIWLFLDVLFSTASIMHLCAISLDRYIAIKKPIQHSQFKSRAKALAKIALVWLISVGIAIPIPIKGLQLLDHPNNITFNNNHTCLLSPEGFGDFKVFGSLTAFFIPLAIMMIIYLLTIQVLRKKAYHLRSRASRPTISTVFQHELPVTSPPEDLVIQNGIKRDKTLNPFSPITEDEAPIRRMSTIGKRSMQNLSNEQRASKVLGIVFMLFVVMWCPFFITNVTSVLCEGCNSHLVEQLLDIFQWVGYVSSGINPLVYTLFNRTFREAFTRYITCNYNRVSTPKLQRRTRISFRSSVAENSKRFMKHGMKNGISPVSYQSPLRRHPTHLQSLANITLDTLLLTENEDCKPDENTSYV